MSGGLGGDHGNIYSLGWRDRAKPNVEAMSKHEHLARSEKRLNRGFINFRLSRVGRKDHDHICPIASIGHSVDSEAGVLGFCFGRAVWRQSDADVGAAVRQIESMGVALGTVADDGNFLAANQCEVGVIVVVNLSHDDFPLKCV